jgi:dynamin 1-like protein
MEYLKATLPVIQNHLSTYWTPEEKEEQLERLVSVDDNKIIRLVSELNSLFPNSSTMTLSLPRLITVGSQSSSKSSVLNRLCNLNVLPTGSSMTTRVPLNMELIPDDRARVEFGDYAGERFTVTKTIPISYPAVSSTEKLAVRREIETRTVIIAGEGEGIGSAEIIMKVYAPNIQRLSLIDLPGLISVNRNRHNIKEEIERLIESYITQERTLILCVMPARVDIETDQGLGFIAKYDPKFERVIGLLSKPDLMNDNTDIKNYLENRVPDNLKLKYGYYAVMNRVADEESVVDALKAEREYFQRHPVYGSMRDRSRLGIRNLNGDLNTVLTNHVRSMLPDVLSEIIQEQARLGSKIIGMGTPLPESKDGRSSFLHQLVSDFCQTFIECLEKRGTVINSGRQIKDVFVRYRENVDRKNPFDPKTYHDGYIVDAIKDSEGNHMSSPHLSIEVLEHFLQDPERRPIASLVQEATTCATEISQIMTDLVNRILSEDNFQRFPKLVKRIKDDVLYRTINQHLDHSCKKIKDIVSMEETYIWTDDPEFLQELDDIFRVSKNQLEPEIVRSALYCYFKTVKKSVKNIIPKTIMYFLVASIEKEVTSSLFEYVGRLDPDDLLEETSDEAKRRNDIFKYKKRVDTARARLEELF